MYKNNSYLTHLACNLQLSTDLIVYYTAAVHRLSRWGHECCGGGLDPESQLVGGIGWTLQLGLTIQAKCQVISKPSSLHFVKTWLAWLSSVISGGRGGAGSDCSSVSGQLRDLHINNLILLKESPYRVQTTTSHNFRQLGEDPVSLKPTYSLKAADSLTGLIAD